MEHFFETREEASAAAAQQICGALQHRLENQPEASLVVSGGTTPARCLQLLAETDLAWAKVHVLLSDERWVAADADDSNEKLVREQLLRGRAAAAKLLPVFDAANGVAARCESLDREIRTLPFPFACALLGMGEDGHFASLFADADTLREGLDVDNTHLCVAVHTAASPYPRVSLTLSALSRSDEIVLLIFGATKREVYEKAKVSGNTWPVASLLKQKRAPVRVYWAP
jgi:6-phosphogluconolactonase